MTNFRDTFGLFKSQLYLLGSISYQELQEHLWFEWPLVLMCPCPLTYPPLDPCRIIHERWRERFILKIKGGRQIEVAVVQFILLLSPEPHDAGFQIQTVPAALLYRILLLLLMPIIRNHFRQWNPESLGSAFCKPRIHSYVLMQSTKTYQRGCH